MDIIIAAIIMGLIAPLAVLLTLVALPGTWIILLTALVLELFWPDLFSWYTLVAALLICILAEVAEFLSSAAGAAATKASKRAVWASIAGGLIGAILATIFLPFLPILATILGGAVGAGIAAALAENTLKPDLRRSLSLYSVGRGAALGRLSSTIVKSLFTILLAIVLFTAILIR